MSKQSCICNWPDCNKLAEKINKFADLYHPWRGGLKSFSLTKNASDNVKAIRHSISHQLHVPVSKKKNLRYNVQPHHWTVPLLEFMNARKKGLVIPLSLPQAEIIAEKDIVSTRLLDNVNKMTNILTKIKSASPSTSTGCYVCAPVSTRKEVQSFVDSFATGRTNRVATRMPVAITPVTSGKKKPSKNRHINQPTPIHNLSLAQTASPMAILPASLLLSPEDASISNIPPSLHAASEVELPSHSSNEIDLEVEAHRQTIMQRYAELPSDEIGTDHKFLSSILTLKLVYENFNPIPVISANGSMTLMPCRRDFPGCKKYAIRKGLHRGNGLCTICQTFNITESRRVIRKRKSSEAGIDRTAPDSTANITTLSPSSLPQQISNLSKQVHRLKVLNRKLRLKTIEQDKYITIKKDSSNISSVLNKAFKWVEGEGVDATRVIVKSLIDLNRKKFQNTHDEEELNDLASEMVEDIKNVAKKMDGDEKQVRFSPRTLRVCLALYLRTPQGYKDFKNQGGHLYPSARRLEELKRALKVEEGFFPPVYSQFFNFLKSRKQSGDWMGHLLFDEIKLKSDVAWNCRSNQMIGFCSGSQDGKIILEEELEKVVTQLIGEETETPIATKNVLQKELAVYANQWRFRSCYGVVHNAEFFYSKGNLDGDDLVRQWMHVHTCYEAIGCKIFGMCADAGGANASFYKLIRTSSSIDDTPWLSEDSVSTTNFIDPTRKVYCWHCCTHNCKNCRNGLLNSTPSGSKNFQIWTKKKRKYDTVHFGWTEIEVQHQRNNKRIKLGENKDTDLTRQSVYPDKWNKMNVSLAKAPFTEKSIFEMMDYLSKELDCFEALLECKLSMEYKDRPIQKMLAMLNILKEKVNDDTPLLVCQTMLTFEYTVVIHSIFIERFLNTKGWKLRLSNIDEEEAAMKKLLTFFSNWKKQNETNKPEDENISSHFLAPQTYLNIRIGCAGFFYYARSVLSTSGGPQYVPAPHSHQSSIEALFSEIRMRGHDSVTHYGRGVSTSNFLNQSKNAPHALTNNPCYDQDDVGEEVLFEYSPNELANDKKRREKTLSAWQKLHRKRKNGYSIPIVNRFPETFLEKEYMWKGKRCQRSQSSQVALGELIVCTIDEHYSAYLFEHKDFREFAKMTIGTPSENWFKTLLVDLDDDDERVFDKVCQKVVADIYDCLEATIGVTKNAANSKDASFRTQLLQYLQSLRFEQRFSSLPEKLQIRAPVCYLVQHISELLLSDWIPKIYQSLLKELVDQEEKASGEDTLAARKRSKRRALHKDVNRYFGWAIFSLKKRVQNELKDLSKANFRKLSDDEKNSVLELLGQMRMFEHEILGQKDYIKNFYYPADFLRNNGFLTLVHPRYAWFALDVVTYIFSAYNEDKLLALGNDSIYEAKREVKANTDLQHKFLHLTKDFKGLGDDVKLIVLAELLEKTCNAKMGYLTKLYKSKTTGRGGSNNEDMSLRGELKPSGKKNKKKKATKTK